VSSNRFLGWLSGHRVVVGLGAIGLGATVWMVIPAVADRGDVALVGDRSTATTFPEMVTQIRDSGRQASAAVVAASPCAVADELADADLEPGVDVVVIAVGPHDCGADPVLAAVDVARDRGLEPVVVRLPETDRPDVDATVVDTEVLLGAAGVTSRPCEWWDRVEPFGATGPLPCNTDNLVVVRFADGSLTDDGIQRVARMVAAAIG
jgi:hypothetical protein